MPATPASSAAVSARPSISTVNIAARAGSPMTEAISAILFDVTIKASSAQSPAMLAGETRPMLRSRPKHRQSLSWHQLPFHRDEGGATVITCIIRYHIDPTKKTEFERYARNWGQ